MYVPRLIQITYIEPERKQELQLLEFGFCAQHQESFPGRGEPLHETNISAYFHIIYLYITSLLFSAETKNAWRCASTSPYTFMAWCVSKHTTSPIVVSYRIRKKSVGVFCGGDNCTVPKLTGAVGNIFEEPFTGAILTL